MTQTLAALEILGWNNENPTTVVTPHGRLSLIQGDGDEQSAFEHFVPESLRMQVWAEAASRREDMQGIDSPHGVDKTATGALLPKMKGPEKGHLQCLAVQGAEQHARNDVLQRIAQTSKKQAIDIQRMYLKIIEEHSSLAREIYEARREQQGLFTERLHHFARRGRKSRIRRPLAP